MAPYGTKAEKKIGRVMQEYGKGRLKNGRSGSHKDS